MSTKSLDVDRIRASLLTQRTNLLARLRRADVDERHEREPLSADFEEQAVERENDEVLQSIEASCASEVKQIDSALRRLADGQYGLCESCGREIEQQRLTALASATKCGNCAASAGVER
jgi:RNA polymerase-binding transcription factor DksA